MLTVLNIDPAPHAKARDNDDELYPNSLIPGIDENEFMTADPQVDEPSVRTGFWQRQFQSPITRGQKKFDWLFGVILPVLCFYFDPIVFQAKIDNKAYMAGLATFSYVLSFTAILGTMAWLLWGEKLKWLNAPLAGLFAVSSVTALAIGLYIAPISLIGLLFVIGVLGFTPFFCSFALLRNSVRTFRTAKISLDSDLLINSFVLAAVASAVIPYLLNIW